MRSGRSAEAPDAETAVEARSYDKTVNFQSGRFGIMGKSTNDQEKPFYFLEVRIITT